MEFVILILIVVAIGIAISVSSAKRVSERKAQLIAEAREFVARVEQARALPVVTASIVLRAGEAAFYAASSALYETRAIRQHRAGHAGFRVAKGVYIGGTRGRSHSTQEWTKIDDGYLVVTNKRLVFDGGSENRTVQLSKVVSAEPGLGNIEVSVEGRQKSMIFDAANPMVLATVIRICCQTEDPRNLADTKLKITFE